MEGRCVTNICSQENQFSSCLQVAGSTRMPCLDTQGSPPSQVMRMQLSDMGSPSALRERRMVEMLVASKGLDPLPPGEEWKVSPCL